MSEAFIKDASMKYPMTGRIYVEDKSGIGGVRLVWQGTLEDYEAIRHTFYSRIQEILDQKHANPHEQLAKIQEVLG